MPAASSPNRRRCLPPGGETTWWTANDGWEVRTIAWPAAGATPGSLLFASGRADFIEKYCESLWEWRDWGLGVASFDWRGQGLSGRLGDHPLKGHADDFERWVNDFAGLLDWFTATLPPPHYLVAHSMGAHLALRHLVRGDERFAKVALVAPMIELGLRPLPHWLVRLISLAMTRTGGGQRWALSQGPRRPGARHRRRTFLTGDATRYEDVSWWRRHNPALGVGGVTYGWLAGAFRSIAALRRPDTLERVRPPVLILMPEHDRLVDVEAGRHAALRLPDAAFEIIEGAAHELLRESDPIRRQVQAKLRRFLLGD